MVTDIEGLEDLGGPDELESELEDRVRAKMEENLEKYGQEFFPKLYQKGDALPMITELKDTEIYQVAYVSWFEENFFDPQNFLMLRMRNTGEGYLENFMALRISKGRKGRAEAASVLTGGVDELANAIRQKRKRRRG